RLVYKHSRPKPHRHFAGEFTTDAAHRDAYGRPCQFLQESSVGGLVATGIVGRGRLKPRRKAVSKTHNVTRGHHQDPKDSTGLPAEFTMPFSPWMEHQGITPSLPRESQVKSRYFLDDSAPPGYE